jgi:hypothetical protein
MGVTAFIRASKNVEDLSHVIGEVTKTTMIKHVRESKYKTVIEDVLVLQIEGSDEKFGFLQGSDAFKALLGSNIQTVELYYDPKSQRIEEGVTLHIFDLRVGQGKIIDIEQTNKRERNLAIFFFALTVFLVGMIVAIVRQSRRKRKGVHYKT